MFGHALLPSVLAGFALWAAATIACAAFAKRPRSPWTLLAGVSAFLAPLAVSSAAPELRFVLCLLGSLVLGRALDLTWRSTTLGVGGRLWFLLALFDVRAASTRERALSADERRWLGLHAGLFVGSCAALMLFGEGWREGPCRVLRYALGAVNVYALPEILQAVLLWAYARLGIRLPVINERPITARTLGEFWGRRWNRVVAGWLRRYAYLPLARRRRPKLGLAAAFTASAALHFWVVWLPLDLAAGLSMAAFFGIHGLALALERRLEVRAWPPARQRLWSCACFALTLPLFVGPMLRLAGW